MTTVINTKLKSCHGACTKRHLCTTTSTGCQCWHTRDWETELERERESYILVISVIMNDKVEQANLYCVVPDNSLVAVRSTCFSEITLSLQPIVRPVLVPMLGLMLRLVMVRLMVRPIHIDSGVGSPINYWYIKMKNSIRTLFKLIFRFRRGSICSLDT